MNKDTKITLGLIAVTALGYYLWKKSQVVAPVVASNSLPSTPIKVDPMPSVPVAPIQQMPIEYMAAPTSNFVDTKPIFAPYANMAANPTTGGFFESQSSKLNY